MDLIDGILGFATLTFVCWLVRDKIRHAGRNNMLDKLRKLPVCSFPFVGQSWYFHGSLESEIMNVTYSTQSDHWELKPLTKPYRTFIGAFRILNETLAKLETPFVAWIGNIATVHLAKLEDIEVRRNS